LTDYGNRIDNEGIAKIFHSSESNNKDRVMEVLITDPNPASNHAVPQGDVYCYRDSASESTFVLTGYKHISIEFSNACFDQSQFLITSFL
jgi:hypothetical protein